MINIIYESTQTIDIDSFYDILAQIIIQNEEQDCAVESFNITSDEGEENECSVFKM